MSKNTDTLINFFNKLSEKEQEEVRKKIGVMILNDSKDLGKVVSNNNVVTCPKCNHKFKST